MDIVPSAVAGSLSASNSCEVVVYGARLAIVGLPSGGGEQPTSISLAVYDPQTRTFVHQAADPRTEVLVFKGSYVLEPNLQSGTMLGTLGPVATDELFFIGETPMIVVRASAGDGWRAMSLTSGELRSATAGNRPCFKRWRLGVRDAEGKPTWLFDIQ
jgi:hypothetical protein